MTGETVTTRGAIIGVAGGKGACGAKGPVLGGHQAIGAIGAIRAIEAIGAIGASTQGVVGTGRGKASGGGICLDKGLDAGIRNHSGPNVGNGLIDPSGKPGHDEKHRTAGHIKSCESKNSLQRLFPAPPLQPFLSLPRREFVDNIAYKDSLSIIRQ